MATWNGPTERGAERKLIYFRHRKMRKHQESVYCIINTVSKKINSIILCHYKVFTAICTNFNFCDSDGSGRLFLMKLTDMSA